jgi:hypothetical protein
LKDGNVPLLAIPPSLVNVSGEHEWMSEVGERETTAECRLVGLSTLQPSGFEEGSSKRHDVLALHASLNQQAKDDI